MHVYKRRTQEHGGDIKSSMSRRSSFGQGLLRIARGVYRSTAERYRQDAQEKAGKESIKTEYLPLPKYNNVVFMFY